MAKFIRPRLDDIQEHLGPTLHRLGLRPIVRRSYESMDVLLVPVKGNVCWSPVEIIFDDKSVSRLPEASWKHAHLNEFVYSRRVLGDTGWASWKYHGKTRHDIEGGGAAMYEWLSTFIDQRELIPDARTPNCLENSRCGDAYLTLARNFSDVAIHRLEELDQGQAVEVLTFKDDLGRQITVPMRAASPHAPVYVDDEKIAIFPQDDMSALQGVVLRLKNDADLAQYGLR
ncbi:hypothetical protein HFO49_30040 [Rhizobium leguminosarum]|uniref:hypothetical protein n=1 Tax=Rhizobium leguminosarum TaxID=384 RepID=UPI001C95D340|nr:hypothetical protein [Rhizobium leguminosarum]MBY5591652.1 hypothetical protein [Rhizobium leguminosarum]